MGMLAHLLSKTPSVVQGPGRLAVGGLAFATAGYAIGQEHGMGAGLAYAAASANPLIGTPLLAAEIAQSVLDWGNKQYSMSRRSEMGRPVHDNFGNLATMRRRSFANMNRGRSVLGNEARLFHD